MTDTFVLDAAIESTERKLSASNRVLRQEVELLLIRLTIFEQHQSEYDRLVQLRTERQKVRGF